MMTDLASRKRSEEISPSTKATKARLKRKILKLEKSSRKRKRSKLQQKPALVPAYSGPSAPALTQESVLAVLALHNEHALEIRPRLEPAHFGGEYRTIAERVLKYIDDHGRSPGAQIADLFVDILERDDQESKKAKLHNKKAELYDGMLRNITRLGGEMSADFTVSQFDTFIGDRKLKDALTSSLEIHSSSGDMMDAEKQEQIKKILAEVVDYSPSTDKWPEPLDLAALDHEPTPQSWIIEGLMPEGYMTLLAGDGGIGKSHIISPAAVCIASGEPWLGIPVQRRRVLLVSGEDDQKTLERRIYFTCRHLGISTKQMKKVARRLTVYSLVGQDTTLWRERPRYGTTSAYHKLKFLVRKHKTEVLILDRIGNFYGGNENDSSQVQAFVNTLLALFPSTERRAVLLPGHVSKLTAANPNTNQGYRGSTEWHNAARARWYLREQPDGTRILVVQKSNFGPKGQTFRFTWDNDERMFVGEPIDSDMQKAEDEEKAEIERQTIINAMAARLDQGEIVHAARTGAHNTFRVLHETGYLAKTLDDTSAGRKQFWRRLEELRAQGVVGRTTNKRDNRHSIEVLELKDVATQGDG